MFFTEENYRWRQYYLLNYRLLWLWRGVGMWYAGQGPGAARHINTDLSHHYHIQHSAPATTASPHRGDTHFLWSGVQGAARGGSALPAHSLLIALPLFVDYYVVGTDATNVWFVWIVYYPKSPKGPKNDLCLAVSSLGEAKALYVEDLIFSKTKPFYFLWYWNTWWFPTRRTLPPTTAYNNQII